MVNKVWHQTEALKPLVSFKTRSLQQLVFASHFFHFLNQYVNIASFSKSIYVRRKQLYFPPEAEMGFKCAYNQNAQQIAREVVVCLNEQEKTSTQPKSVVAPFISLVSLYIFYI